MHTILFSLAHSAWEPSRTRSLSGKVLTTRNRFVTPIYQRALGGSTFCFCLALHLYNLSHISGMLYRHNIVLLSHQDLRFSCPEKDNLGLKIPVVYGIPCKCGQVCTGHAGQSTEARVKNTHQWHI